MSKHHPKPLSPARRNFLKFATLVCTLPPLTTLSGCTHKKFFNPDDEILLGGGRFKQNDEIHHVLAVINLQQQETERVELEFMPHGILIDPRDKQRLISFEKNGVNAAEIDLANLRESSHFQSDDNTIFAGHGAFSPSGDLIYSSEIELSSRDGYISIRNSGDFKVIDRIPSFGHNPHQCKLNGDGKILVVANTGSEKSPATLNYIDVENKALLDKVSLDEQSIDIAHFSLAKDGRLVIGSAPRVPDQVGAVSIGIDKHNITTMKEPGFILDKLFGEALSISIDEKHDVAAVTHPDANLVTFWALESQSLIKAISVPDPRGITLSIDGNHFIVSFGINTGSVLIDTNTLTADTSSIIQPTYTSGEHIINWSRTLREIMPKQVYS